MNSPQLRRTIGGVDPREPRAGSTLGKALAALREMRRPLHLTVMANATELPESEVDSMLRYGVREGMIKREEKHDGIWFSIGSGVPLKEPKVQPAFVVAVPAPAAAISRDCAGAEVLSVSLAPSPAVQAMGHELDALFKSVAAEVDKEIEAPVNETVPPELTMQSSDQDLPPSVVKEAGREARLEMLKAAAVVADYMPKADTIADRALNALVEHGPLSPAEMAKATRSDRNCLTSNLLVCMKHGLIVSVQTGEGYAGGHSGSGLLRPRAVYELGKGIAPHKKSPKPKGRPQKALPPSQPIREVDYPSTTEAKRPDVVDELRALLSEALAGRREAEMKLKERIPAIPTEYRAAEHFRVGIFSDGECVIEEGVETRRYPRERAEMLARFFQRLDVQQVVS